ncbi:hypothetical protein RS82_00055 [Microbacterium trichothecenolyticum]|uniref:Uncharacterized protein n=1 Tax=Microbacterium trichothecenolyticum TaxID=69370 RepID=A0A0M2HGF3_MICTR|nr:hypothetical protein RS82_00055 [Microbacterium trichothecenolyticum]
MGGVGATTMSLLLPSDEEALLWPRIVSTAMGVLLTAVSSAVVAYVLTRVVTVSDVERRYTSVLDRIARSLAHVYTNLQLATSQRRSGAYEHEETYQEVILASASSVLAEFDSVTRLSGSISGAFKESKRDLDEIQSIFVTDPVVVQTLTAARMESAPFAGERVSLACPRCDSRVSGQLAMRAGWTATVTCNHCRAKFNIHRKGDLTVYASAPAVERRAAATSASSLAGAPGAAGSPQEFGDGEGAAIPPAAEKEGAPDEKPAEPVEGEEINAVHSLPLSCPSCNERFSVRYRASQVRDDGTLERICVGCACSYRVVVATGVVSTWTAGVIESGTIVARRASHVLVACPIDGFPLPATFPSKSGDWRAYCPSHRKVVAVTRPEMRAWMEENDPGFLAARLLRETDGAARILSDIG